MPELTNHDIQTKVRQQTTISGGIHAIIDGLHSKMSNLSGLNEGQRATIGKLFAEAKGQSSAWAEAMVDNVPVPEKPIPAATGGSADYR